MTENLVLEHGLAALLTAGCFSLTCYCLRGIKEQFRTLRHIIESKSGLRIALLRAKLSVWRNVAQLWLGTKLHVPFGLPKMQLRYQKKAPIKIPALYFPGPVLLAGFLVGISRKWFSLAPALLFRCSKHSWKALMRFIIKQKSRS